MKKIFYEKIGKKYVPVNEYDSDLLHSLSNGSYLVTVRPSSVSTVRVIEPMLAPMIAAGLYARDKIEKALLESSNFSPVQQPITLEQKVAWDNLAKAFGDGSSSLQRKSVHDIAHAGVQAMQDQAQLILKNESARRAFEHFLLVSKLSMENT
jgi:hypothetical protein